MRMCLPGTAHGLVGVPEAGVAVCTGTACHGMHYTASDPIRCCDGALASELINVGGMDPLAAHLLILYRNEFGLTRKTNVW